MKERLVVDLTAGRQPEEKSLTVQVMDIQSFTMAITPL